MSDHQDFGESWAHLVDGFNQLLASVGVLAAKTLVDH